uniref:short-chain dehydrogenase-like n=1 Tax=Strongylocentrotus purpuratus TaxID=7668 RepID=UPI0000E480C6|nr:short-chain dehydrogenase-like [Strongylocentrotus purpuratus]|eukprot:NP_001229624.1 short-chain dehydrogenase-like [Strongylocentrotus purpuratus]
MEGKVALITGSSSGIGAGIAERFAEIGCRLALTGRDAEKLKDVGKSCCERGLSEKEILVIAADLTEDEDLERIFSKTIEKFGRLDILINNAGRPAKGRFHDLQMTFFDDVMRLNLRSAIYLSKLAIPYLKESKGCVVNMSSVASKTTCDYNPTYSISKVALDQFTKSLAVELGPYGVRVNSLNPGVILTPLYRNLGKSDAQVITWSKSMHPIGRHGTVDEVVKATEYLVSDASRCVTGTLLSIDGGRFLM